MTTLEVVLLALVVALLLFPPRWEPLPLRWPLWCRRLYWRWHTRRALRRLHAKGIKPTMSAEELYAMTREK